jgi:hypothetical protein
VVWKKFVNQRCEKQVAKLCTFETNERATRNNLPTHLRVRKILNNDEISWLFAMQKKREKSDKGRLENTYHASL